MNIYLQQFFNTSLEEHLAIILPGDMFLLFWGFIIIVASLLFFGFLPIVMIDCVRDFVNNKLGNKRWFNICLDIFSFLFIAIVSTYIFNLYPGIKIGLNAEGIIFNPELKVLSEYAKNIGSICGVLFSLLLNSRIWNKWFKKLGIEKIRKIVFGVLTILFLFVFYYFYYVCHLI